MALYCYFGLISDIPQNLTQHLQVDMPMYVTSSANTESSFSDATNVQTEEHHCLTLNQSLAKTTTYTAYRDTVQRSWRGNSQHHTLLGCKIGSFYHWIFTYTTHVAGWLGIIRVITTTYNSKKLVWLASLNGRSSQKSLAMDSLAQADTRG